MVTVWFVFQIVPPVRVNVRDAGLTVMRFSFELAIATTTLLVGSVFSRTLRVRDSPGASDRESALRVSPRVSSSNTVTATDAVSVYPPPDDSRRMVVFSLVGSASCTPSTTNDW